MTDVRAVPIELPPMEVQRAFGRATAAIEQQVLRGKAHLVALDTLFAVLRHRAFAGAL